MQLKKTETSRPNKDTAASDNSMHRQVEVVAPEVPEESESDGSPEFDWQSIWDIAETRDQETEDATPSRSAATYASIKRMILAGQVGPRLQARA